MRIHELSKQITVRINKSSTGVILEHPNDPEYLYIFTAKHCVTKDGQELVVEYCHIDNSFHPIDTSSVEKYIHPSEKVDFAILRFSKKYFSFPLPAPISLYNSYSDSAAIYHFRGFPNKEAFKDRGIQLDATFSDTKWPHQLVLSCKHPLLDSSLEEAKAIMDGFSGSGIIMEHQGQYTLVGIITELTTIDGTFGLIEGISLEMLNGFLQEISLPEFIFCQLETPLVSPPHLQAMQQQLQEALGKVSQLTKETLPVSRIEEINQIKLLRKKGQLKAAMTLIEAFKERSWATLVDQEKYTLTIHHASCYDELGENQNAAYKFIEAQKFAPDNVDALAYAALGYIFLKKNQLALPFIEKGLSIDRTHTNMQIAQLLVKKEELSWEELLENIPPQSQQCAEMLFNLGVVAEEKQKYQAAIQYFTEALQSEDNPIHLGVIEGRLGVALLRSVHDPFAWLFQMPKQTEAIVDEAITHLTHAWDTMVQTDSKSHEVWILVNRGLAKRWRKDLPGAYDDFKMAFEINHDPQVVTHLILCCDARGYYQEGLTLLTHLDTTHRLLLSAALHVGVGKYSEVIELLTPLYQEHNKEDELLVEEIAEILVEALLEHQQSVEAEKIGQQLLNHYPQNVHIHTINARIHLRLGNLEKALNFLQDGKKYSTPQTSKLTLYLLGRQLLQAKDYLSAIEVWESIIDRSVYSSFARELLQVYYQIGQLKKALEFSIQLTALNGYISFLTIIQRNIYMTIKDTQKAIDVCQQHLTHHPSDQKVLFALALIYAIQRKIENVHPLLAQIDIHSTEWEYSDLFRIAQLYVMIGERQKGMDIAYQLWRDNYDQKEAHQMYVSFFLSLRLQEDEIFTPKQVEIETAVTLASLSQKRVHFICEGKAELENEIIATEPLAQQLLGYHLGSSVVLSNFSQVRIEQIRSKYIYAFQESTRLLKERFVDVNTIRVMDFIPSDNPDEYFQPLHQFLNEQRQAEELLKTYYEQGLLSLGFCARRQRTNPIKVCNEFINEIGVFCILSDAQISTELKIIDTTFKQSKGILLDLTSLLILNRTKSLALLQSIPVSLHVAQSTINHIEDFIAEFLETASKSRFMLDKHTHQVDEITPQMQQEVIDRYQSLLEWCRGNLQIHPSTFMLEMDIDDKKALDELLEESFADSVLIAQKQDYILWAEENLLRTLAKQNYQVKGFCLYSLLRYLLHSNKLFQKEYNSYLIQLITHNYKYVPIPNGLLFEALDKAEYRLQMPFVKVANILRHEASKVDYAVKVAADFLKELYASSLIPLDLRDQIAMYIISLLCQERLIEQTFFLLKQEVEYRFRFLYKQKKHLMEIIDSLAQQY